MLQTISFCQLKILAFYVLTSQSIVTLVHNSTSLFSGSLGRTVFLPKCSFTSFSGEGDISFTYFSRVSSRQRKIFWCS